MSSNPSDTPQERVASPSDAPRERVVSILKKLDDDASRLRHETELLQATHDQWAPAKVGGRTTLMPGEKPLPSRCADKLDQAAGYERQMKLYMRRQRTGDREAQRAMEERQVVESAAEASVNKAEQRRQDAERRLQELQQKRKQDEALHARSLSADDLNTEAELVVIENDIEKVWKAAAAHSSQARVDTAVQRAREGRDIQEAIADFEARSVAHERSLEEFDATCAAGVVAAQGRVREVDVAILKVWEECQVKVQSSQEEAEGSVQAQKSIRDSAVDETNRQLSEEELQLNTELAEIAAREQVVRADRSAEQRVEATSIKVFEDISKRRAVCDARVQECLDTIARLTKEAGDGASAATRRAQLAQARTDKQVEAITIDIEKFADSSHKGKILELQSSLKVAVAAATDKFSDRLRVFQESTDQETLEAGKALVNADRKVEELRVWANGLMGESAQAMDKSIKDIRTEREHIVADSSAKVQRTQDQMVQYVGSQFEDMLHSLSKTDPLEVPLRFDYSTAILN